MREIGTGYAPRYGIRPGIGGQGFDGGSFGAIPDRLGERNAGRDGFAARADPTGIEQWSRRLQSTSA